MLLRLLLVTHGCTCELREDAKGEGEERWQTRAQHFTLSHSNKHNVPALTQNGCKHTQRASHSLDQYGYCVREKGI